MQDRIVFGRTAGGLRIKEVWEVVAVICLSPWLAYAAAAPSATKPEAPKLTAAQRRERLRSALQGKTGPKVSNPRAPSALANSSIMAMLRSQEQAADAELRAIKAKRAADPGPTSKRGVDPGPLQASAGSLPAVAPGTKQAAEPGPISKSASANSAISGNKAISGNGVSQTTLSQPGGGAPQQPMGTRNASGNQALGGATVNLAACVSAIQTVNGSSQPSQTVFTPITTSTNSFNWYVVRGCGFGNKPGNAHLSGPFTGGQLKLRVDAWAWTDTYAILRIDPALRGELDHDNVTLVLEPLGAAPIQKSGFKFYAARETVPLSEIPRSAVKFSESSNSSMSVQHAVPDGPTLEYTTPSLRPAGTASVFREWGTTIVPNGTDHFDLSHLTAGFMVDGVVVDMLDPHNPSKDCSGPNPDPSLRPLPIDSRGIWSLDWPAGDNNFRVTWRVWLCRMSFMGLNDPDVWSEYTVNVSVRGPRGVDPWTGRRLLNLSPTMPALH